MNSKVADPGPDIPAEKDVCIFPGNEWNNKFSGQASFYVKCHSGLLIVTK
jgi:hypothetical protein